MIDEFLDERPTPPEKFKALTSEEKIKIDKAILRWVTKGFKRNILD
jgi:hypothetical protein